MRNLQQEFVIFADYAIFALLASYARLDLEILAGAECHFGFDLSIFAPVALHFLLDLATFGQLAS